MAARRRARIAAALLAAVIGLSVTAPSAARSELPSDFYGITPATRLSDEEFARMGAAKLGTLRVPFFWQELQPLGRHHFAWRRTDRIVERAALNGIQVLPFVLGVPRWLREPDEKPALDPQLRGAWSDLLTALVERYGRESSFWSTFELLHPGVPARPITTWQIWNEPSDSSYWEPVETAPERYAVLLRLSDEVLAEADPEARVIAAGLWERPIGGIRMGRFLARLYRANAGGHFDAVALHPYASRISGVIRQIEHARRVMRRFGDSRKPLWITEIGWPTQRVIGTGGFVKSEPRQAALLRRVFRRILRARRQYRIERLVWYTWRDNELFKTCNLCRYSGLFRQEGTPKPAWEEFVAYTGGSAEAPPGSSGPLLPTPPLP